jgi:voltage-gated potassium channel
MDTRSERTAKKFEIPMLIAALLVIPAIVLEESNVTGTWKDVVVVLNWSIWLAFVAELVVMLAVVRNRWNWLAHHPLEVALVLLTPPFLPASMQSARLLRLFRVLRLIRVARLARGVFSLTGLRWASVVAVLTVLGGGAAFASAEKGHSTWDSVYWALTTMTTAGYGDLAPKTDVGRAVSVGIMLVGLCFVAILTGAVAERFLARDVAEIDNAVGNVTATEQDLLRQVQALGAQVRQLEAALTARIQGP